MEDNVMRYMDNATYKNLKTHINDLKWALYLPTSNNPANSATNISMLHSAVSLLKKTLKQEGVNKKESESIINAIRRDEKQLLRTIDSESILITIDHGYKASYFALPLEINTGIITSLKGNMLKPLEYYFSENTEFYLLNVTQNGCKLFSYSHLGMIKMNIPEIEQTLNQALNVDEHEARNIQTHRTNIGGNNGSDGFHGQGGFKDRHKAYRDKYLKYIDSKLSRYSNNNKKPIIIVGTKPLATAFANISKNKSQIKGYLKTLPTKFDFNSLSTKVNTL